MQNQKSRPDTSTRDAYGEALVKLGKINPNVVVLDADLSESTRTKKFAGEFPQRFFNLGVAEANMIGTASGLATCGKIPFASTFAVFASGRAWDQLRMSVCYAQVNVKIGASHSGISVGEDGASHQASEDIALMRALPHMTVIVPADAVETEKAVYAAAEFKGPVYLRLGRLSVPIIFDENYSFEIGRGKILKEGKDACIIACGLMVQEALEARENLLKEGIEARVVNISTIKPIDEEIIIESAIKTGAIVTCEEHNIIGGLGSAVAEVLGEGKPVPLKRIGIKNTFGESGSPKELFQKYGLTSAHIIEAVKEVRRRKNE